MSAGAALFDRVVCGVDCSDAGRTAARVAGLVASPAGSLTLVSAYDGSLAVHAGWNTARVREQLAAEAGEALERGRVEAESRHPAETKLVEGPPLRCLLAEIAHRDATAVVVGSHGLSRASGIVLGAVSTALLHEAPCAVLIARGEVEPTGRRRRIVVGVDGSTGSADAVEAAAALAARLDADVRAIVATKNARLDLEACRRLAPGCEEHEGKAIDVLGVASETADLIVVGSRGLRGIRALGSLSERIAHEARCSVLVVRPRD